MRKKLTESVLKNLEITGERYAVRDIELRGFSVRVGRSGTKSFYLDYRPKGAGRSVAATSLQLGTWPGVSVVDARALASAHKTRVVAGGNPSVERREAARAQTQAVTLRELLAESGVYEKELLHRRLVNWKTALSSLRRNLEGVMALTPADMRRKDYADRITALNHAGKEGAATDFRKFANSFIEWCVNQGHVEHNVLAGWKLPPKTREQRVDEQEEENGRALEDWEIKAVWRAAERDRLRPVFGALVKTYLLTGFRRTEGARLKRSAITAAPNKKLGLTGERVEINARDAKNGFAHAVPMTEPLRAVVRAQPKTTSEFLFASPRTGKAMSGWTKMVARLQEASGVDFTLHDLRRTCRTRLSMLGVDNDIAELCIGHVRPDLERRYNKFTAWEARVEAFEKYNAHIMEIIGGPQGGKVIPLHAA